MDKLEIKFLLALLSVLISVTSFFAVGYLSGIKEEFALVNRELTTMNEKIGELLQVYVRLDEKNTALENRVVRNERDIERLVNTTKD